MTGMPSLRQRHTASAPTRSSYVVRLTCLSAICTLVFSGPLAAATIDHVVIGGKCLAAVQDSEIPILENCEKTNLGQYWFRSGRDHMDGMNDAAEARKIVKAGRALVDSNGGERSQQYPLTEDDFKRLTAVVSEGEFLRSALRPGQCVTSGDSGGDRALSLRECLGSDRQQWGFTWKKRLRSWANNQDCIGLNGEKSAIEVRPCKELSEPQKRFSNRPSGLASNWEMYSFVKRFEGKHGLSADHPLNAFLTCYNRKHSAEDGGASAVKCYKAATVFDGNRYGYFYGSGYSAGDSGNEDFAETFDFGDRYSLDRCAYAHDKNFWVGPVRRDDGNERYWGNDLHVLACLRRVNPGTTNERKALKKAWQSYEEDLGKGLRQNSSREFGRSCLDRWNELGELPPRNGERFVMCAPPPPNQ
jgi:hypothetical protein